MGFLAGGLKALSVKFFRASSGISPQQGSPGQDKARKSELSAQTSARCRAATLACQFFCAKSIPTIESVLRYRVMATSNISLAAGMLSG